MAAVVLRDGGAPYGAERRPHGFRVANPRSTYAAGQKPAALDEETLSRLWEGQRFPAAALVTRQGVRLRTLRPGRRGRGAGPDFRDALVAGPGGRLLRGDVELHVRSSDFRRHGHDTNPGYDGVALHVVFEDDDDADTRLASGRSVPVVAFAPWVRARAGELARWLSTPQFWREPCHDALARMGADALAGVLDDLGEARFAQRVADVSSLVAACGPGDALLRLLLEGAGYGRGEPQPDACQPSWLSLSERLLAAPDSQRVAVAEALLLGSAGYLTPPAADDADAYAESLSRMWQTSGLSGGQRHTPDAPAASRRPASHPARRLAGVARLIVRHMGLLDGTTPVAPVGALPPKDLIAAWTVAADGYWASHIAPWQPAKRSPGALIGRSRAIELLVNALLPWAAAVGRGEGPDAEAALRQFRNLPRPGRYGSLAFLEKDLEATSGAFRIDARRQQGLLALYKSQCTQGGCGRCALS